MILQLIIPLLLNYNINVVKIDIDNMDSYHKYIALQYADLIPSNVIVQSFIDEIMVLDDTNVLWSLKHSTRVKYARMLERTAKRETNYGTAKGSWRCNKQNNHTGTKHPRKRKTYSLGPGMLNYAKFENWTYSYLDCLIYIMKYKRSWIK